MSLTLKPIPPFFPILHHFWLLTKLVTNIKRIVQRESTTIELMDKEILKLSDNELMVRAITGKVDNAKVNAKTKRHCKRSE